jgi:hypothetical protein
MNLNPTKLVALLNEEDILGTDFLYWPCLVGKDIVFRFIIKYSSLRDFGPLGNNNRSIYFYMRISER